MFQLKHKFSARVLQFVVLFAIGLLMAIGSTTPVRAEVPTGCPGGPAGTPEPGTICENGVSPNPDPDLPAGCPGSGATGPPSTGSVCPARPGRNECAFSAAGSCVPTSSVSPSDLSEPDCVDENINQGNCKIVDYLVVFTRVLSGLVGVVVVIMIAVGGIQYASARDNPQAVAGARGRIINAVIALIFYLFSFAILQWLIPGGIL